MEELRCGEDLFKLGGPDCNPNSKKALVGLCKSSFVKPLTWFDVVPLLGDGYLLYRKSAFLGTIANSHKYCSKGFRRTGPYQGLLRFASLPSRIAPCRAQSLAPTKSLPVAHPVDPVFVYVAFSLPLSDCCLGWKAFLLLSEQSRLITYSEGREEKALKPYPDSQRVLSNLCQAAVTLKQYGKILVTHRPGETTAILLKLCTQGLAPARDTSNRPTPPNGVSSAPPPEASTSKPSARGTAPPEASTSKPSARGAVPGPEDEMEPILPSPMDFVHVFVDRPRWLLRFFEQYSEQVKVRATMGRFPVADAHVSSARLTSGEASVRVVVSDMVVVSGHFLVWSLSRASARPFNIEALGPNGKRCSGLSRKLRVRRMYLSKSSFKFDTRLKSSCGKPQKLGTAVLASLCGTK